MNYFQQFIMGFKIISLVRSKLKWIMGFGLALLLVVSFFPKKDAEDLTKTFNKNDSKESEVVEAAVINYGEWHPKNRRSVIMTVESDAEVTVQSEVSGTVASVYAKPGQYVYKGQKLAQFSYTGDATQIQYLNAQNSLQSTKDATQNSISQAEISLANAEKNLQQTRASEKENFAQTFDTLKTQTQNSKNTLFSTLDFMDRWAGVSNQYRYEVDPRKAALGSRTRVKKNDFKNEVESLVRNYQSLPESFNRMSHEEILNYANQHLSYAKELQKALNLFDSIARLSNYNANFTVADESAAVAEIAQKLASLNGEVLGLEQAITAANSFEERSRLTLLSAQNQVENAKASLELAKSNAASQVRSAQNQVNVALVSQQDLTVRAPFAGTVSEEFINVGQQVRAGENLFTLVNESKGKRGVAFISFDEFQRAKDKEIYTVVFNQVSYEIEGARKSSRLEADSQKMRFEIDLPNEIDLLVGQLGKLELGVNTETLNYLPVSAVSFEPSGAEVLVVKEGETHRQNVEVDTIEGDAVLIKSGLEPGTLVIQYRRRYYSGQNVKPF